MHVPQRSIVTNEREEKGHERGKGYWPMREKKTESEAKLCQDFIEWASANSDWVPYAETAGFDILLAAPDGSQLGIHAKRNFNATLLRQALPDDTYYAIGGTDYRGILIPEHNRDVYDVCESIGLLYFHRVTKTYRSKNEHVFAPKLTGFDRWPHWNPEKRFRLPEYIPDVAAGVKCPVRLTEWKIAALKIIALIDVRGFVTRQDFKELGIDHRRWTNPMSRWLEIDGEGRYIRGKKLTFDKQHPRVYRQIVEATKKALAGGNATELLGHSSRKVTEAYLDPEIVARPAACDRLFRP